MLLDPLMLTWPECGCIFSVNQMFFAGCHHAENEDFLMFPYNFTSLRKFRHKEEEWDRRHVFTLLHTNNLGDLYQFLFKTIFV
jgi:hypothetical protein